MNNRVYVRTDKNGTKIYHDFTCDRCGGRGGSEAWKFTGWTCYKCGGSGRVMEPQIIKEYTPEYRAKLDAQAAKRREKKLAQAQAEKGAKQAEWKASKGFQNDRIHVVGIEDSFNLKNDIKAAGGRYNEYTGWYFSEPHEEFKTVEITAEEALIEDEWGKLDWRNTIRDAVKAKQPANPSKHIGAVGDKLELEVTHIRTGGYDTQFGYTYVHSFKDADGNILVWKTAACSGFESTTLRLKGTVKDHDEYNGVKQTILTRCKIA